MEDSNAAIDSARVSGVVGSFSPIDSSPLTSGYANIDSIMATRLECPTTPSASQGGGGATPLQTDSPSSYYTADNHPTLSTSGALDDPPSSENATAGGEDPATTSSEPTMADDGANGDSSTLNEGKDEIDDITDGDIKENGDLTGEESSVGPLSHISKHTPPSISSFGSSPAHGHGNERRFFCREWAWAKLWACVEQRPSAKTCGVLIIGGPGTGKTALCSQLVAPSGAQGRHASSLQGRILAHHFCHSHDATSLDVGAFIRSLVVQLAESLLIEGYANKVVAEEVACALAPGPLEKDPDEAFRRAVLFPLLEVEAPDRTLLLLVDSVDELSVLGLMGAVDPLKDEGSSKSILELLSRHHHLLPQWLLLVVTARKASQYRSGALSKAFSGFRRVALDDLRRSHVVRDVQQYILCRLDTEPALRHHLSRETAEMLNQLHIKSNGCFLYLEKVLDGVAEGWVTLREIRDIPGTLNGLYLWLCQRLYPRRHFQRLAPLLAVILAARAPLAFREIREAVSTRLPISDEEWGKRHSLLKRVLCPYAPNGKVLLFHHSFAEWLLDVKHCTQKYLVNLGEGHTMLAMSMSLRGPALGCRQVQTLAFHLARVPVKPPLESFHLPLWLLACGVSIVDCFEEGGFCDPLSLRLLQDAGAKVPALEEREEEEEYGDEEEEEKEEAKIKPEEFLDDGCEAKGENVVEELKRVEEGGTQTEKGNEEVGEEWKREEVKQRSLERPLRGQITREAHTRSLKGDSSRRSGSEDRKSVEEPRREVIGGGIAEGENSARQRERRRRRMRDDPLYPYLRGGPIDSMDAAGRTLLHTAAHSGDASLVNVLLQRNANHAIKDRGGQTPLNLSSRHGHADVVRILLSYGADPDHADDDGWTSLRSAAWAGHVGVVEALLKGGARADLADADGRTALRAAAWGGHEDVVATLLENDAGVNRADSEGRTPLIAAAYMGHCEIVAALIAAGAAVNHSDKDGRSALSVGALCVSSLLGDPCAPAPEGRLQVVTTLLEGGADVDHSDKDGLTPLLVAAFEGHVDVCELLLEYDADVDHVDRSGRTPLLAAASMGHAAVVERLLFWGCYVDHIDVEGRTVLSVTAAQGSQETVRLLLDRGLDETHRDNAGWTPLHYAAFEGHRGVCEALVDGGARINEVDNDGKHALVLAAQEGHVGVVATLLDAGAALHHTSHDGRSALRVAALEEHKEVVRLLLCRGADLHYKDADGRSTLYLLALEDRLEMAGFLLESGADVESKDLEGRTPLHVTSWQGHARMVELLLAHGAMVDAEDNERRTPLQSAAWQGNAHIVRLLLQHGASTHHACSQGATALSIAAQEGHEECVALLLQFGANPAHSDHCGRTAIKVALKGGHHRLARMLEEHLDRQQQKTHHSGTSTSTAEAKPCASLLCPGLSPAGSPESTFEKRRSCVSLGGRSSSKSSCNLSTSTRSSGCGGSNDPNFYHHHYSPHPPPPHMYHSHSSAIPPIPPAPSSQSPALSFTQQLQQCGRARGRKRQPLPQPPLTPLDEPASPIYASPPISPVNEAIPPPLPQRMNPMVALLEEEYALPCHKSKRHLHRMTEPAECAAGDIPRKAVVVSTGSHVASHFPFPPQQTSSMMPGQQPPHGVAGAASGFTFTQDSHMRIILGSRSPEARPKRNGIVTNPSLKAAHAKAAHILRNGLPGRPRHSQLRPNGLNIKKETPL